MLFTARLAFSDAGDYSFTASSGTFTAITGGTDVDAIEADDVLSALLPIGFTFNFDGTDYTQVKASSNGWLTFNTTATSSTNGNNLDYSSTSIRPLVAPLWDDLDGRATSGSQAKYTTTGSSPNRVFTMEWLKWEWNYGSGDAVLSFQVKLYETSNKIEIIYQQEPDNVSSGTASIGIAGSSTGPGHYLSLDGTGTSPSASSTTETSNLNTKPATGQVYAFDPPVGPGLPTNPDPTDGAIGIAIDNDPDISWTNPGGTVYNEVYFSTTEADVTNKVVGARVLNGDPGTVYTSYNQPADLAYNTAYYWRVLETDGTGTRDGDVWSFTTACGAYNLPIVEGFNAATIPNCWSETVVNDPGNDPALTYVTSGTYPTCSPYEGTHMVKFNSYNCSDGAEIRLESPEFSTVGMSDARVLFAWYESSNYPLYLDEGVTVQWSTDGATWNNGTFYQRYNATEGWYDKIYDLPGGALNQGTVYVGFLFHSRYGNNCYFDDVTIEETPSCVAPTATNETNITNSGADLGWTDAAGYWDLYIVPTNDPAPTAGSTPTVNDTPNNPYTWAGGNASTTYDWYVRRDCGQDNTNVSVWTTVSTFTTLCDPFTATFSENFDGTTVGDMPDCWHRIVGYSSGYVKVDDVTPYSSPNTLRMYNSGSTTAAFIAATPQLSDLTTQSNQITFYAKYATWDVSDLLVGTMSDPTDESTFTLYQTIVLTSTWTEYTVMFGTGYTGTDEYVAFKHGCNSTYEYLYIDDFEYEPIPSCPAPTAQTEANVTLNSVDFGWTETGGATTWEYDYGISPYGPPAGAGTSTTSNPVNVTGLTANTNYDWYVRADCGGGDFSSWTGPSNFTTSDGKATNPSPADNATGVLVADKTFDWDDVTNADSYTIDIGTATGLSDVVNDEPCPASTYTYTGADWDYQEDYFWTVTTVYTAAKADVTGDEWKFTTQCGPVTTPIMENFDAATTPDLPDCWTVENNVEHWYTTTSNDRSYPNCIMIGYDSSDPLNDWFFTPELLLTNGTDYRVTFWYRSRGSYLERLEVKWGTSANSAGMTQGTIIDLVDFNNTSYAQATGTFTAGGAGSYYIGWHAYSIADQYGIYVDDISITEVQSGVCVWIGNAKSNDWHVAGNWDNNSVPTAAEDVSIPSGCANYPTINAAAECNDITIESGASLLDNSNLTVIDTANVERSITSGVWHLVSAPISDATAAVFPGSYLQYYNGIWNDITDPGYSMTPVQGYSLWDVSKADHNFPGDLNTGAQSIDIFSANDGWNLLGNPYPSALDWDGLSASYGAVYYWMPVAEDYISYIGGVGGSRYVPAMQGFWIYTDSDGTFSLDNTNRVHSDAAYYKNVETISNYVELQVDGNDYYDQLFINLNNLATEGFDYYYDAFKMLSPTEAVPQLYSFAGTDILSIDRRPECEMIQLGFQCGENGNYAIALNEAIDMSSVILEDTKTGTMHNFAEGVYQFEYSTSDDEKRFKLHLQATGTNEITEGLFMVYANNKVVYVKSDNIIHKGTIRICDIMGRIMVEKEVNNTNFVKIPANFKAGIYIVVVGDGSSVSSKKVFIN